MPYTEIKQRNKRKYYYRVISVREGKKVKKERRYLGVNLNSKELVVKEAEADKEIKKANSKPLERIKSKIIPILRRNNVKRAGIFGSYAKGIQNKNSDVDIIIELPKGVGFGYVGIELELKNKLNKKIDLLTYSGIHPLLKKRILGEEVRIL